MSNVKLIKVMPLVALAGLLGPSVALAGDIAECRRISARLNYVERELEMYESYLDDEPFIDQVRHALAAVSRVFEATSGDIETVNEELDKAVEFTDVVQESTEAILDEAIEGLGDVKKGLKGVREGLGGTQDKIDQVDDSIRLAILAIDALKGIQNHFADERVGLNLGRVRFMVVQIHAVLVQLKEVVEHRLVEVAITAVELVLFVIDQAVPVYDAVLDRNQRAADADVPLPYPYALNDTGPTPAEALRRTLLAGRADLLQERRSLRVDRLMQCEGGALELMAAQQHCARQFPDRSRLASTDLRVAVEARRWRSDWERMNATPWPDADEHLVLVCEYEFMQCDASRAYREQADGFQTCVFDRMVAQAQMGAHSGWAPASWSRETLVEHLDLVYDVRVPSAVDSERSCWEEFQTCVVPQPVCLDPEEGPMMAYIFDSYAASIEKMYFGSDSELQGRFGFSAEMRAIAGGGGFYLRHQLAMVANAKAARTSGCFKDADVNYVADSMAAVQARHTAIMAQFEAIEAGRAAGDEARVTAAQVALGRIQKQTLFSVFDAPDRIQIPNGNR